MRTSRLTATSALFILATGGLPALLPVLTACRDRGGAELPPARGEGAVPPPALPNLSSTGSAVVPAPSAARTTGTTYPKTEAQIGVNASGLLTRVPVTQGDRVKKGEVLFRQDTKDAELRVEQARTALSAAEVNLRATDIEYKRSKLLFEQNAINRAQWDQIEARLDGAKIGVEQAKVMVAMMQKMLSDLVVRAPFDGVITAKLKNEGEMATMMPPTVVLILQDQTTLEVRFRLPESALVSVKAKDRAVAKFLALNIEREIEIVRVQPTVDAATRTVEIIADLPNGDLHLRPGLLAEIALVEEDKSAPRPAYGEARE